MKSNFEENIKIDQGNKINSYFSMHPFPTPKIRLNPPGTRLHEARTVSPKIPSLQVPIHAPEPRNTGDRKSRFYSPEYSKWRSSKVLNQERKEATIPSAKTPPYSFTPFLDKMNRVGCGSVLLEGNCAFLERCVHSGHQPFPQQLQTHALTYPNPSSIKKRGTFFQPKPPRPRPQ